jgi:purine-binding chemotaxis protein CheW
MDVLVFEVGGVRYALPASDVREIVRAVTIVPLPKAPPIVEGVIDVRGDLVPVLDVRSRFRLAPKSLSHTDHLVLAWAGPRLVAIRVDRAQNLLRVEPESIADPTLTTRDVQYVAGVAKLPDGLVLIHDLRAFLDEAEATAIDQATVTVSQSGRSV